MTPSFLEIFHKERDTARCVAGDLRNLARGFARVGNFDVASELREHAASIDQVMDMMTAAYDVQLNDDLRQARESTACTLAWALMVRPASDLIKEV